MRLALHCSSFSYPGGDAAIGPRLAATARAADEGGFSRLTLMDHWFQMEMLGGPAEPMLEGYTGLGYLAGLTSRIELGLLVTGVTYRHPGLLAKTVATLDVLSGGRAFLGLGAAWYDREHAGLGVPFPPLAERFGRLEEALQICRQMWGDEEGPYDGTYYRLAETVCRPRPLRTPPVLIGGSGERKTLRLVAQYADACNLFGSSTQEVAHKIEVLDRHCAEVGRDPAQVERTVIAAGTDAFGDDFLRQLEAYARLGVTTVWVGPTGDDPVAWTERAARELLPRVADL